MVGKLFGWIGKEINGLHQAAYLLAFFALLSQILALVRDRLLAHFFGASISLDVYYAAFRIPDFIYISVASIVSLSVLIPFLVGKMEEGKEAEKEFISSIFSFFAILIITISGIVFMAAPFIVPIIFPGFAGESLDLLIKSTRILLFSPILLGVSNLFASITQAYRRFFVYAISPLVYNIGIISGVLFLMPVFGFEGLIYGVVLGAFLHLAVQIPFTWSTGQLPRIVWPNFFLVWKVLILSFPRTITLSINHIAIIFLLSFASLMASGSIAVFNFSFNLQSVPLSIIGVSYSLAAFPTLSRWYAKGEYQKFADNISSSVRHVIFWSIPITILFVVLRAQVVRTILGSGEFSWIDTKLTAAALAIFAISILFQNIVVLLVRGFYAAGNTYTPLFVNIFSGVVVVVSSYFFILLHSTQDGFRNMIEMLLRVENVPGTVVLMLPLGYSVGLVINGLLLWFLFERRYVKIIKNMYVSLYQSLIASLVLGVFTYLFLQVFAGVFDLTTLPGIFLQGLCSGLVGIVAGIVMLKILHSKELDVVIYTLRNRIWKTKVVGPETEITS